MPNFETTAEVSISPKEYVENCTEDELNDLCVYLSWRDVEDFDADIVAQFLDQDMTYSEKARLREMLTIRATENVRALIQ